MKRSMKFTLALAVLMNLALVACEDGAVENFGEDVDEAITDTENKVEDACEKVKEELDVEDKDC